MSDDGDQTTDSDGHDARRPSLDIYHLGCVGAAGSAAATAETGGAKSSATGFSGRAMRISSSIAVNRWVVASDRLIGRASGGPAAAASVLAGALSAFAMAATAGFSGSTKGIGFSSMPLWSNCMKRCQVIAGSVPPVMRRVGTKLSLPYQTMPT